MKFATRKERHRQDQAFGDKYRAISYAKLLRAGLVKRPSSEILQKYNLEELAAELSIQAQSRPPKPKPLTLDRWTPRCSGPACTRESPAAA